MEHDMTPTRLVARRMREVRGKRGWTAQRLADEMRNVGIPWERTVVAHSESGRRKVVSVDELLALCAVLNVAPVDMLCPDLGVRYQVTPMVDALGLTVRNWIRGFYPILPGQSRREFHAEMPEEEFISRHPVTYRHPDEEARSDDGR